MAEKLLNTENIKASIVATDKVIVNNVLGETEQVIFNNIFPNKTDLDGITTVRADNWDNAVANTHTHANKATLDTYTQTEVNLADAVTKKHTANTDTALDTGGTNPVTALEIRSKIDLVGIGENLNKNYQWSLDVPEIYQPNMISIIGRSGCFSNPLARTSAKNIFGYDGNMLSGVAKSGASNFWFWVPTEFLKANEYFNRQAPLTVMLELQASAACSIWFHIFEVNSVGTEISRFNTYININNTRQIFKFNLDNYSADCQKLELRFFNNGSSWDGKTIYIGRISLFGGYASHNLEYPNDKTNSLEIQITNINDGIVTLNDGIVTLNDGVTILNNTTAQSVLGRQNLMTDPYYHYGFPTISGNLADWEGFLATAAVGVTPLLVNNVMINEPGLSQLAKFPITTGYSGYYPIQFALGTNKFKNDELFIRSGKLNFTVEIICDFDVTLHPKLYKHTIAPSQWSPIQDLNNTLVLKANVKQIVHFYSVVLLDNVDCITGYFFYDGIASDLHNHNIYIGRIFAYSGDFIPLLDTQIHTSRLPANIPSKIALWGDSLTASSIYVAKIVAKFPNATIYEGGIGSQLSYHIKDRIINDSTHKSWFTILWIGRNNAGDVDFVEQIISDIRDTVAYLGHNEYLILNAINGDYIDERKPGTSWARFVELGNRLLQIYGDKCIDVRDLLISNHDYNGTKLINSYIQPSVGSNVTIDVNNNSWLNIGDAIGVGKLGNVDYYTVIAIPDLTHLTIRLDQVNVVSPTGTIANITSTIGGTTSTNYKRIYLKQDVIDYSDDIVPKSLRADNIHLNGTAYDFIIDAIYRKMV